LQLIGALCLSEQVLAYVQRSDHNAQTPQVGATRRRRQGSDIVVAFM
jgi:hypothetical protein